MQFLQGRSPQSQQESSSGRVEGIDAACKAKNDAGEGAGGGGGTGRPHQEGAVAGSDSDSASASDSYSDSRSDSDNAGNSEANKEGGAGGETVPPCTDKTHTGGDRTDGSRVDETEEGACEIAEERVAAKDNTGRDAQVDRLATEGEPERKRKKGSSDQLEGASGRDLSVDRPGQVGGITVSARCAREGTLQGAVESDEETLEFSVPGSTLLLASKSPVFKSMFSTGFREGAGVKQVDIKLNATGQDPKCREM